MSGFGPLMREARWDGAALHAAVPAQWLQGRTVYGGLGAALCAEAARRAFPDLPPLRTAQISYIGPCGAAPVATPTLLRHGKSAAYVGIDLVSDGALATRTTLMFGASRAASLDHADFAPPDVASPDSLPAAFPTDRPGPPAFLVNFDVRRAGGYPPLSGAPAPAMLVWARHREPFGARPDVDLLGLADVLPPAALPMMTAMAPISTMVWHLEFLDPAPRTDDGWWLLATRAEVTRDGYSAQETRIWNAAGAPALIGRQMVAIYG